VNFSDRFFLQRLGSLELVGVYAVGYKFGFMMNHLVVQPFFTMWQSRMYAIHAQPQHVAIFRRIFDLYSLGLIYAGLAMSLFAPLAVHFMAERKFWGNQDLIPVVVLGYVFYGLSYYAQLGLLLTDRTRIVAVIGTAAASLNLLSNYVLISKFGMMGAAWATALSFVWLAAANYLCSQRVFRLPLSLSRMWAGLIAAAATYVLCRNLTPNAPAMALLVRGIVLVMFPILLWKLGLLGPAVVETAITARNALSRKLGKREVEMIPTL
jgi:O-antigen/teichoic acid export membrane protein